MKKNIFLLICFSLCLSGCVGLQFSTLSKPTIVDKSVKEQFVSPIGYVFNDSHVLFTLTITNSRTTRLLIIPPIPWLFKEGWSTPPAARLCVNIFINPQNNFVKFNPEKVGLWKDVNNKMYPIKMEGPYTLPVTRNGMHFDHIKSFDLQMNIFNGVTLMYDINEFSPSEKYFVEIGGLEVNGNPHTLSTVFLEKDKTVDIFTLP